MNLKFVVVVFMASFMCGCVKVQILPEDTVKNTFKAGKNLYDNTKLKQQGGKKRQYASQEVVADHPSKEEAEASCISALKDRLETESTKRDAVVVSERVIVVDGLSGRVIECQVAGYVWP